MNSTLPLAGRRFLVTRPQPQAADFVALLEQQGGSAVCIPTIEIVPPKSWAPFDFAMQDLDDFDILILTSVNGVAAFFERLLENNQYYGVLTDMLIVAVGPKTAAAIEANHVHPDIVPADHRAEGIVAALMQHEIAGKKILYPRAEIARPLIIEALKNGGAEVTAPVAYRTIMPKERKEEICNLLRGGDLDAICFSSSSTFANLYTMLGDDLKKLQGETKFFSIGPQTSETIRRHGFEVALEPEQWTLDALVLAMADYYSK
ncbi:Uroporphyrinogen-III synthase [Desulfuromusa kysingii]|uniref:Uroporphyrinogen-III synthase n=1 Tax=Desulfuromusa kysingii TaxID=37625 RepID=A0A1H3XKK0_9BACT|nr:uroporphyrinogen-III synthase [Desulfuromusa kysingii]SDZ99461.1 Uroporphyrinogen-III synthase [Desulfuromusa kysingii]